MFNGVLSGNLYFETEYWLMEKWKRLQESSYIFCKLSSSLHIPYQIINHIIQSKNLRHYFFSRLTILYRILVWWICQQDQNQDQQRHFQMWHFAINSGKGVQSHDPFCIICIWPLTVLVLLHFKFIVLNELFSSEPPIFLASLLQCLFAYVVAFFGGHSVCLY